jgi:Txe/YoeB family toxin of Txe-Axe toxin-antitoxin module
MNLNAYYNFALAKMGMNLVTLANELKSLSFLILMSLRVSQGDLKPQGVKQPLVCILDSLNKILEVLTNELPNALPRYKKVDHKIEMVLGSSMLLKAPYRLNQKELEKLKKQINDLFSQRYIWQSKLFYGASILFVDKKDNKLKMCIDYHALSKIIIKNNYLLPRIDNLLDQLNGAKYFI